jgi:hypothetical protein
VSRIYEYKIFAPLIYSSILDPLYRVVVLKILYALWSQNNPAPKVDTTPFTAVALAPVAVEPFGGKVELIVHA